MKLEQKEAAHRIYFQTDIPVSEIAEILNVSERTMHYWIEENGWAEIKKSAQYMPIKLIDNCYRILGNLQDHLLSDERKDKPVTHLEVNSMHKLVNTITKLRTRNTLSENIELNSYFLEYLNEQNPQMVEQIRPYIDGFLATRVQATKRNKIQFQSPQPTPTPAPKPQPIPETESDRFFQEVEIYRRQNPEKFQEALEKSKAEYLLEHPNADFSELDKLFNNKMPQQKQNTQTDSLNTYATPPSPSGEGRGGVSPSPSAEGRGGVPLNRAQRRKLERARKAA